jgi:zinc D-Ala-D-Ala carboxypeptidase
MRHVVLGLVAVLAACGAVDDGPVESPVATESAGFDTDLDPETLMGEETKSDGDPCADYAGGDADGTSLLALVNKTHYLPGDYAPEDLLPLGADAVMPGRRGMLRVAALRALEALQSTALMEASMDFRARSAYRGFREQCFTFNYWVKQKGAEHAGRFSARPGRSQHQLGTTVDLTTEAWGWVIEPEVALTEEAAWLAANAGRFGFVMSYPEHAEEETGYAFEPWHFRYVGGEAAAEAEREGLILEHYLRRCRDGDAELTCPEEIAPLVPVNHRFIGGACADDSECASLGESARCLTDGHPEGHCTVPCTRGCPDRAGNNQRTFCAVERDGAAWCRSQCDFDRFPDAGCRGGYACLDGERPNAAGQAEVCRPDVLPESPAAEG